MIMFHDVPAVNLPGCTFTALRRSNLRGRLVSETTRRHPPTGRKLCIALSSCGKPGSRMSSLLGSNDGMSAGVDG